MDFMNFDCLVEIAEKLDQNDVYFFAAVCSKFYFACKRARRILKTERYTIATSILKLKWSLKYYPKFTYYYYPYLPLHNVCDYAARTGNLEILKWARNGENKFPWNSWTTARAAQYGQLEVLKWLRSGEDKCPWDEATCAIAAEKGHLEILKWLRRGEDVCPWDERTCSWAASGGHLEILKWARDNNCPWDAETCHWAAQRGHLEILKWARHEGCPWTNFTILVANHNPEILRYCKDNGLYYDGNPI